MHLAGPDPRGDRRLALDTALALLLTGLGIAEAVVPFSTVTGQGSAGVAIFLTLTSCLPLALRRRLPLLVLVIVTIPPGLVGLGTDVLVLFWGALVPMAVALYTVARYGRGRTPYAGPAIAGAALALMALGTEALQSPGELFFPCLVLLVSWLVGRVIGRQEHHARASEQRAREVAERSREEALLAIAEERSRIARELHDVVAHAVTAMVVQAGAAGQVVRDDPDYVSDALDRIHHTGSRALDEMRRVVSLLRESEEGLTGAPQPGLADLPALVAASSTTSTRVRLEVDGTPQTLPGGRDLAAYRIVQEAITNAHRHARASDVAVRVAYREDAVHLEVRDNGIGHTAGTPGHGLIGMRERAAACGGWVEFSQAERRVTNGLRAAGATGFTVRAELPVEQG